MRVWLAGLLGMIGVAASIPLVHSAVRERNNTDAILAQVEAGAFPDLAVLEPEALAALERQGLSLGTLLGSDDDAASLRARAPVYRAIADVLAADLGELNARPRVVDKVDAANHPFRTSWLGDARARYDLVGALFRPDRITGESSRAWGELRLVFRLTLAPEGRPTTRMPMTLNVLFAAGPKTAEQWQMLPPSGPARVRAILAIYKNAGLDQIEVNLQNLHGPSTREDADDHAEYLLRAFDVTRVGATPKKLFNTPRMDLSPAERDELAQWVISHAGEIDHGEHVVPEKFLATRTVSVTPRGLARQQNRAFTNALGASAARLDDGAVPYDAFKMATSRAALLRRLDEGTCTGCHQTRSIAGFHLLGTERSAETTFNALTLAGSPHLYDDMRFRAAFVDAERNGTRTPARPFSFRSEHDEGAAGAACGVSSAFARYACAPGLVCRDVDHGELGACARTTPRDGDACQNARVVPAPIAANAAALDPDGDRFHADSTDTCAAGENTSCSPNGYGFHGGLCSSSCDALGQRSGDSGSMVCADLPGAGYESECFFTREPIEKCMMRNALRRRVAYCDISHRCRADFACVRVPGLPMGEGACAPPYFLFQARVDGPPLDR